MRREGGSGQWLVSATRWERRGDGAEHMVDEVPGGDGGGSRQTVDMVDVYSDTDWAWCIKTRKTLLEDA